MGGGARSGLELHRSRFVEWQPAAVVAIAVAPGGSTVALARESGDLEIYDTADWRCVARVPGKEGAAISCLTWVAPFIGDWVDADNAAAADDVPCRLLSAGLDGVVTEWDLSALRARSTTDSHGGAVWAMAAEPRPTDGEPQRVAIACDDGCIRLLTLLGGDGVGSGLSHRRSFLRLQGRLLSLAWGFGGTQIAVGTSVGTIHIMQVATLSEVMRITVGSGDKPKESDERCTWALTYLPDGTLVSGGQDGDVTFWDKRFGTQLYTFRQHGADVTCLASNPAGTCVFASGIDSQVCVFNRIEDGAGPGLEKWTFGSTKRPHTHDVRALAMAHAPGGGGDRDGKGERGKDGDGGRGGGGGPILLSGGNDAQLLAYPANHFQRRHPVRVVSVPQRTPCSMTGGGLWTAPPAPKGKKQKGGKGQGNRGGDGGGADDEPVAPKPTLANAPTPPLLLCDHGRCVDLWRLGEGLGGGPGRPSEEVIEASKANNGMMKLASAPTHVLRAKLSGKRRTLSSAISPDGALVAISDAHSLRLFEVNKTEETPGVKREEWTLRKQDSPVGGVTSANCLLFTPDGKVLVAVGVNGAVHVVDLESWEVMRTLRAHLPKISAATTALDKATSGSGSGKRRKAMDPVSACDVGCPAVSHACASADGQWLAVVTTKGGTASRRAAGVHVYNLDALKLHKSLPPPPGLASWPPVAAMALSAAGVLALAVRDNAIVMYDVEAGTLTPWSAAMATAKSVATAPPKLKTLPGQICGLSFDPTPGSQLLLAHTPSAIARVNLAVVPTFTPAPITKKRRRKGYRGDKGGFGAIEKQGGKTSGEEGGGDIKVVNLSDPCLFLGYFAPGQALMVERPWDDVLNAIEKPPYQRHLFGT